MITAELSPAEIVCILSDLLKYKKDGLVKLPLSILKNIGRIINQVTPETIQDKGIDQMNSYESDNVVDISESIIEYFIELVKNKV